MQIKEKGSILSLCSTWGQRGTLRCSLTLFSLLFIFCGDGFIYSFLEYNCGTVLSESAVQHEPAVSIHTPHCLLSLPPGCIPPLWAVTEHQAEFPLAQGNLPLALCLYLGFVYRAVLLSRFMPPFPSPHHPPVCPLCLQLYSCPANSFICTIFQIPHTCVNIWYLFFWLTSLCVTDPRSFLITTNDSILFLFMAE